MAHYEVLGVARESTYDEIKSAFHQLARTCHPDKTITNRDDEESESSAAASSSAALSPSSNSFHKFRQIQQAWEILRDETRRNQYNHELQQDALREKAKRGGVVHLQWTDLEEAQDEDTGETIHVYDCRCGEELVVDVEDTKQTTTTGNGDPSLSSATNSTKTTILMECPGCCFVYELPPAPL
jgi:DnaJ-class molecular chaperone